MFFLEYLSGGQKFLFMSATYENKPAEIESYLRYGVDTTSCQKTEHYRLCKLVVGACLNHPAVNVLLYVI